MVKFANNCTTWWNSQKIAKHDEIHNWPPIFSHCAVALAQHGEITYEQVETSSDMFLNDCTTWWNLQIDPSYFLTVQWHLHSSMKLINRLEQAQNMFWNDCTTWWNSQTIAQYGEIQKQLNNTPNRNYKNYRSCFQNL